MHFYSTDSLEGWIWFSFQHQGIAREKQTNLYNSTNERAVDVMKSIVVMQQRDASCFFFLRHAQRPWHFTECGKLSLLACLSKTRSLRCTLLPHRVMLHFVMDIYLLLTLCSPHVRRVAYGVWEEDGILWGTHSTALWGTFGNVEVDFFFIMLSSDLNECTGNHGIISDIRNSSRFESGVISRQIYFDGSSSLGEEWYWCSPLTCDC